MILDERSGCWRAVTPHAGRLVLFLCDGCLHKVEPCMSERYAITAWWCQPNISKREVEVATRPNRTITVRTAHASGPRRFEGLPDGAAQHVVRQLEQFRRT